MVVQLLNERVRVTRGKVELPLPQPRLLAGDPEGEGIMAPGGGDAVGLGERGLLAPGVIAHARHVPRNSAEPAGLVEEMAYTLPIGKGLRGDLPHCVVGELGRDR